MTDMTEIKASDGKLYVSAIFDCYDLAVLGLAMDTNMRATLCEQTLENACKAYPMLRGAILHSDREPSTSELYRKAINRYGIVQSMNSAGGIMIMPDAKACGHASKRNYFMVVTILLNDRRAVKDAHLEILHQLLE